MSSDPVSKRRQPTVARDPEELLAGTEQCGEVVVQGLPARVLDLVVLAKCQWQRREVGVVGLDNCGHSLEDVTSIGEMVEGGWREDNPLLLDTQMADEEGREVPELADLPGPEAEVFAAATVDGVRGPRRLRQAAEGNRVVRATTGDVSERVREGPVTAAARPVPPERQVDAGGAAENSPTSGEDLVPRVGAQSVRVEVPLMRQRLEIVLQGA